MAPVPPPGGFAFLVRQGTFAPERETGMPVDPLLVLVGAGSLGAGIVIGLVIERRLGAAAKRAARLEEDLAQVRSELTRYREETKQHFGKSAELLGRMATDYREFLDHFVHGAEELCGPNLKEINVSALERPRLEPARGAEAPAPSEHPMDSEPLADDLPKELHGLAGEAPPAVPLDRG